VRENFWYQGMQGSVKGEYDCIQAFSETDFTEDFKKIHVPTLVMHGGDEQIRTLFGFGSTLIQAGQERAAQSLPAKATAPTRARMEERRLGAVIGCSDGTLSNSAGGQQLLTGEPA
jgi:pimeloyl-ACP methyl ester carboxylesterase